MCGYVIRILLVLAFVLSACQWNVGTLEIRLVYPVDNHPLEKNLIKALRVRVEGDDMSAMEVEFSLLDRSAGVLSDVPLGSNRVVTVEGLDTSNTVQSRGITTPFEVKSGTTTIYMYISRVGVFSSPPFGSLEAEWTGNYSTSMTDTRAFHATTVLHDHELLISGGVLVPNPEDPLARVLVGSLRTVDRFEPTAGAFLKDTQFRGMLAQRGRAFHTASLLPDRNLVLLIGGEPVASDYTAEYYNADRHTFEDTDDMRTPRTRHMSAGVEGDNPGILIAGGAGSTASDLLNSVELFRNGLFEPLTSTRLAAARAGSAAVAVPGGVLVTGGWSKFDGQEREVSDQAELIELNGGTPVVTPFSLAHARAEHTAVLLTDPGRSPKVLVCGGLGGDGFTLESTCELITLEGSQPEAEVYAGVTCQRWRHTATPMMVDGKPAVMLAGGFTSAAGVFEASKRALLIKDILGLVDYEPLDMISRRAGHTATVMENGMLVLIGGASLLEANVAQMASKDYEIFNPR